MAKFDYDVIVIGGGAGGFVAAKLARGFDRRVAIIEKEKLGGECTWTGCIPSKALIRAARTAHEAARAERFGFAGECGLRPDKVFDYVRSVVRKVYKTHTPEIFAGQGIEVFFGEPQFVDEHTIRLDGKRMSAGHFVLSTGSSPFVPPIEGIEDVPYLTNRDLFDLDRPPGSLLILGAGPIGTEMAFAFQKLGTRVTMMEASGRVLSKEDPEISDLLAKRLSADGVSLLLKAKAVKAEMAGKGVALTVEFADGRTAVEADALLVASGRSANVSGLSLENAGVEYSPRGVRTDLHMMTTGRTVYACGDVAGPFQFSHMAEYQARLAVMNLSLPVKRKADYSKAAWCTFSDPEVARLGMTEEEAREAAGDVTVYRYEFSDTDRGRTDSEEYGRAKFVCGKKGELLGAHILGDRAGELIHELQLLRYVNEPFHRLANVIHVYPAFNDVIKQAAKESYIDRLRSSPALKALRKILLR